MATRGFCGGWFVNRTSGYGIYTDKQANSVVKDIEDWRTTILPGKIYVLTGIKRLLSYFSYVLHTVFP